MQASDARLLRVAKNARAEGGERLNVRLQRIELGQLSGGRTLLVAAIRAYRADLVLQAMGQNVGQLLKRGLDE